MTPSSHVTSYAHFLTLAGKRGTRPFMWKKTRVNRMPSHDGRSDWTAPIGDSFYKLWRKCRLEHDISKEEYSGKSPLGATKSFITFFKLNIFPCGQKYDEDLHLFYMWPIFHVNSSHYVKKATFNIPLPHPQEGVSKTTFIWDWRKFEELKAVLGI